MQYLMAIEDILRYLPHRYPFLLIDRVLEITVTGEMPSITALKNITANEAYFSGHFPNKPVMPGVLIVEAMAQAAAVLAGKLYCQRSPQEVGLSYLAGIDHARFKRVVVPGDQLRLVVTLQRQKRELFKFQGTAYVADEVACFAEFLSMTKTDANLVEGTLVS